MNILVVPLVKYCWDRAKQQDVLWLKECIIIVLIKTESCKVVVNHDVEMLGCCPLNWLINKKKNDHMLLEYVLRTF